VTIIVFKTNDIHKVLTIIKKECITQIKIEGWSLLYYEEERLRLFLLFLCRSLLDRDRFSLDLDRLSRDRVRERFLRFLDLDRDRLDSLERERLDFFAFCSVLDLDLLRLDRDLDLDLRLRDRDLRPLDLDRDFLSRDFERFFFLEALELVSSRSLFLGERDLFLPFFSFLFSLDFFCFSLLCW